MKRLVIGSLSVLLLSAVTASLSRAETKITNSTHSNHHHLLTSNPQDSAKNITPYNLVLLAYRGYFIKQGIPSYTELLSAHHMGKISAEKLVQVAIAQKKLSPKFLRDRGYLNAVESALHTIVPH